MAKVTESIRTEGQIDYLDRNTNWVEIAERQARARERLAGELKQKCRHELVGEIIKFQVADGYAEYMVKKVKPLQLIHLSDGDAWQADPILIRGLRVDDVRQIVRRPSSKGNRFQNF